jgi:hypothetical protein
VKTVHPAQTASVAPIPALEKLPTTVVVYVAPSSVQQGNISLDVSV